MRFKRIPCNTSLLSVNPWSDCNNERAKNKSNREKETHLLRSLVVLTLVAVLDDELRRRFVLADVGAAAVNPSTLANRFKISVKDTTPCNFPNNKLDGVALSGGVLCGCE